MSETIGTGPLALLTLVCPAAGPGMAEIVLAGLVVLWIGVGLPAGAVWLWLRLKEAARDG